MDANKFFLDGILALSRMEQQGFRIDLDYIYRKKTEIDQQIIKLEKEFISSKFYTGWKNSQNGKINIYSPIQLSNYIYGVKKIRINKETITGQGSTDEETLKQLGIPELEILLKIKKLKKIRDTYLEGFVTEQVDGYIHPFFNLHLVKTFRGSSSDPNFQNIPKRDKEAMDICRKAIFPRPGHLLMEVDYKQLEVRVSACYCDDKKLIRDILEGDMHRDMASEIFCIKKYKSDEPSHKVLRGAAKNGFVFPQFYGDYYKNCASNLAVNWGGLSKFEKWKKGTGIQFENVNLADHLIDNGFKSLDDFTLHIQKIEQDFWGKRYYTFARWKEDWWEKYQKSGIVYSKTGFEYTGVMNRKDVANYPIQGSAFHCLLWDIIEINKAIILEHLDTRLIGQIHDALVLDVNPKELDHIVDIVKCIMCYDIRKVWDWIIVPLDIDIEICDVDKSWAEKKEYKS